MGIRLLNYRNEYGIICIKFGGNWEDRMKIGAYQFAVSGSVERNYSVVRQAILLAAEKEIQLIVFPECALTGYPPRNIVSSSAVAWNTLNDVYDQLQSIVDRCGVHVIIGSIIEDKEQYYNCALHFAPGKDKQAYYKRALWGWDAENFNERKSKGIFDVFGWKIGVRICYEIRFPEFFRELYNENTDLNVILFYDVSDENDEERYGLIDSHIRTRAVENVTHTLTVNAIAPYQTAPTILYDRSGRVLCENTRNEEGLLVYELTKEALDYGEQGRKRISDRLMKGQA